MERSLKSVISNLISGTYTDQSLNALNSRENQIKHLLEQRKCPINGWQDITIELLINRLSLMDSNNYVENCGIGERESRFASDIVMRRHFRMGHGIGRSGDICETQPKAIGSSLLNLLANSLMLDVIRSVGSPNTSSCFIVPLATGMSLVLCLLTLRQTRINAKYVLWPRIDQKSCFKSIITAGFIPIVIDNQLVNDSLVTNIDVINEKIKELGHENVVCILSTTSCFAPRNYDDLEVISKICLESNIPHIVNNAYGIQSSKCMHFIEKSSRNGRIDAYVQSTDKNFMVPVGGSIIAGFDDAFISQISSTYPGRGASTPSIDVLITLLHLGINGYKNLLKDRKQQFLYLKEQMKSLAERFGGKVFDTKNNDISIAISLDIFNNENINQTMIGSMLFLRCVSGARVVPIDGQIKTICGHEFKNWGSHTNSFQYSYLTAAAAIGVTKDDIDIFIKRLNNILISVNKKHSNHLVNNYEV